METFFFDDYSKEFRNANISRKYFTAEATKFLRKDIIASLHKESREAIAQRRYPSKIKISAHYALWPREQRGIIESILRDKNIVQGICVDEITFRKKEHDFVIEFVAPCLLDIEEDEAETA